MKRQIFGMIIYVVLKMNLKIETQEQNDFPEKSKNIIGVFFRFYSSSSRFISIISKLIKTKLLFSIMIIFSGFDRIELVEIKHLIMAQYW